VTPASSEWISASYRLLATVASVARSPILHSEHGYRETALELRQRSRGGGVAGSHDELDALAFEKVCDLESEATDLGERPRPVRQAGAVAQVDEVLVRQGHQALVQDGEPTDTGVEYADRAGIHAGQCNGGPGGATGSGAGRA